MKPSLRFEIFKRDRFRCAYCGRTPPEVLLHVDHVVPKSAGGDDEPSNLVTACVACNQGKGARVLEEGAVAAAVTADEIDERAQRVEQSRQYRELLAAEQDELDACVDAVFESWSDAFDGKRTETGWQLPRGRFPNRRSIETFLRKGLPLEEIIASIGVAHWKTNGYATATAERYFYGVCWNKIRERSQPEEQRA